MLPCVLTIGHSTHTRERLLALLAQHGVEALVDIRRFPGSRKFPQFNQEDLAAAVQEAGIEYHWLESLGGRRRKAEAASVNLGLHNSSFRNYADYMLTQAFQAGVDQLQRIASRKRSVLMCAESLFWRCHRRLVSDFLVAKGVRVQHIMPAGELRLHTLTPGAVVEGGRVTYPGEGGRNAAGVIKAPA